MSEVNAPPPGSLQVIWAVILLPARRLSPSVHSPKLELMSVAVILMRGTDASEPSPLQTWFSR